MSVPRWLFRKSLRAFPPQMRSGIEAEAVHAFARSYASRRRQGVWPSLRYLAVALLDAVRAGLRERRELRHSRSLPHYGDSITDPRMDSGSWFIADVRQAVRLYARRPLVATCVTAVIAIGIAATTAVFSVIEGVLLRPLPWQEPERVVWLQTTRGADTPGMANPLDVADWRALARSFSDVAAFGTYEITMQVDDAIRVGVAEVSEGFDRALGVRALHGRLLAEQDYVQGTRSVVVSYDLWQEQLGGDPSAVGRSILLDQRPYTVVGVLPDLPLRFPLERSGVWTALNLPEAGDTSSLGRSGVWLWTIARLAPGSDHATAAAEMHHLAALLRERHPASNHERDVNTLPIRELITGPVRPGLLLLAAAVALVLIVAAANVGNLLLVTAHGRRQEMAVRATLGAGRARLARQMLTESSVLAALGAALGLALAPAMLRVLLANYPGVLPRAGEVGIHLPGLLVAVAAMLVAALGAALPGLVQTRRLDLNSTIAAGQRTGETRGDQRVRSMLVAAQVALSIVLLFAGAVLWRSFDHLNQTATGFVSENLLSFNLALSSTRYRNAAEEAAMHAQMLDHIRALPGVRAAGTSTLLPFASGEFIDGFTREGHPEDIPPDMPTARLQNITPGFIEALGLQLIAGRPLDAADRTGAAPVVVVNHELQRRYFPEGAVGRRIELRGEQREIVGVVSDKRHASVRADFSAELYLPKAQSDWPRLLAWVTVRTEHDPMQLLPAIRDIVAAVDPAVSIDDPRTMEARLAGTLAPDRFRTLCVVALSCAAGLLALLGLWGLIGYTVARQTRETGIRMALGEAPAGALRRVLLDALRIAGAGAVAGVLMSLAGARLLEGFVAGVDARDLPTLAFVAVAFLCAAVLAAMGPARRASAVAPGVSIRHD